jgi:PadR family transcriptional regulator, regulatory protein PadR
MPDPPLLPKNFLRPCLLLLLREQPAHGYELLDRLRTFGFARDDPGGLYRALRAMEREGFVHSAWEESDAGPDRRIYQLTRAGTEELHRRAKALASARETLGLFLSRYEEFVSLAPQVEPRSRTRQPLRSTAGTARDSRTA